MTNSYPMIKENKPEENNWGNLYDQNTKTETETKPVDTSDPKVKEVRGLGLILAIEFYSDKDAKVLSKLCLKEGLLIILTERFNIRILPPLNVKISEIKKSIKIFTNVLEQLDG